MKKPPQPASPKLKYINKLSVFLQDKINRCGDKLTVSLIIYTAARPAPARSWHDCGAWRCCISGSEEQRGRVLVRSDDRWDAGLWTDRGEGGGDTTSPDQTVRSCPQHNTEQ